jgi:uncharacterized membrane protein
MDSGHRFGIAAVVVALSGVVGIVEAPELPEQLAIHWNAAGEPDGTMSKGLALAFLPAVSAGLLLLFAIVPRIDPLGENVAEFRSLYDQFVVVFMVFLAALHTGIVAFNLGYEFDFTLFVLAGVAFLFYYIGILLTDVKRNWFIGIRTPWTLSNEEVWDRTHELGSRLFKLTALIALVGLFFDEYAIYFLVVPALLTAGITVVYSYYIYEKVESDADAVSDVGQ